MKCSSDGFEKLVYENERNVFNIALKMTGNREDAEDLTQEAFIKAYKAIESFREDSSFSVWLYRITVNVCRDFLRSKARKGADSLSYENEDGETEEVDIPDTSSSPETALERKLTAGAIQRGLSSLEPGQREVLLLREIGGLSYEEIALSLNLEPGTVKSRISRARCRLRDYLIRDGNIPDYYSSKTDRGGEAL